MCSGHSLSGLVSTSSFVDCCSIYMHFANSAQCPCRSHFLMLESYRALSWTKKLLSEAIKADTNHDGSFGKLKYA
jgi:hypothetical protein